MDPKDLSAQELLRLCLQTLDPALWEEFVRRTRPCIAAVISKTLRRLGLVPQPDLVDDLVHDAYTKLFDNNWKALREFHYQHENALFGFLKTVASNIVHDHFRRKRAPVHGGGFDVVDLDAISSFLPAPSANADRQVLISQILDCLRNLKSQPDFQRDWAIFHLYFFDGLTAKAISTLPSIDLEVKGVESTLLRMVRRIRECLGRATKNPGAAL